MQRFPTALYLTHMKDDLILSVTVAPEDKNEVRWE